MPKITPDDDRSENRDRHRLPIGKMGERERAVGGEEGGRIGADRIESDESEIEQAGDTDFEVEAHAHEDEEPDHQQDLANEIAGIERKQRGEDRSGGEANPAHGFAG